MFIRKCLVHIERKRVCFYRWFVQPTHLCVAQSELHNVLEVFNSFHVVHVVCVCGGGGSWFQELGLWMRFQTGVRWLRWLKCDGEVIKITEYIIKMQFIPLMQSWIFSIITPVFSVTRSFRNHSNMQICCSRNMSCYYQCKQLCCWLF